MTDEAGQAPSYYRAWVALRDGGDLGEGASYLAALRPQLTEFARRIEGAMTEDERRMIGGLTLFLHGLEGALSGEGPYTAILKRPGKRGRRPAVSAKRAHEGLEAFNRHLRKSGNQNQKGAIHAAEVASGIGRSDLFEWLEIYRSGLWGDLDPGDDGGGDA